MHCMDSAEHFQEWPAAGIEVASFLRNQVGGEHEEEQGEENSLHRVGALSQDAVLFGMFEARLAS